MKISTHAKITKREIGVRAEDIHEWIDEFFDKDRFREYCRTGILGDFNPYSHRRHRHCREAVEEAVEAFRNKYPEDVVRAVFESHVRNDYYGDYPSRDDFDTEGFDDKYHSR